MTLLVPWIRFPEVAVEWASALLEDCSRERHGVDLFGRDNLLLGRLLTTLVPPPPANTLYTPPPPPHS